MITADLLEKRRSALLVLRMRGVCQGPSPCLRQMRAVEVIMAYLLEKRRYSLLVLRRRGYDHGNFPPFLSRELWR